MHKHTNTKIFGPNRVNSKPKQLIEEQFCLGRWASEGMTDIQIEGRFLLLRDVSDDLKGVRF